MAITEGQVREALAKVNDPAFDDHLFRENFNMHASTSPQYNLIASLDVARKQAVLEGYRLLVRQQTTPVVLIREDGRLLPVVFSGRDGGFCLSRPCPDWIRHL